MTIKSIYKTIYLLLLLFLSINVFSQNYYVKTIVPNIKTDYISGLNSDNSIITYQYYDPLGNPIGKVQQGYTPLKKDLITKIVSNDPSGEYSETWLPTPSNTNDGIYRETSTLANVFYGDSRPFKTNSNSPILSVETNQGAAWNMLSVKTSKNRNAINEVKKFSVNSSGQLVYNSYFNPSTLFKKTVTDEDGKNFSEFTNYLGQVINKRYGTDINTYYVYNNLGQLAYVLPPLASYSNGTVDAINKYGYVYKYDDRGNCNYKKLPGCEPVLMVYDKANRLILSQDGNQRLRTPKQWTVTKYDIHGRLLYTGLINREITDAEKTLVHDNIIVETKGTSTYLSIGYTCNTFNNDIIRLLSVNYYDDHQFLQLLTPSLCSNLTYSEKSGYSTKYTSFKGLKTGTRVYELSDPTKYTLSAIYYDDKARVVQTRSTNHLNGYDFVYNELDFTGKILKSLSEHTISGQSVQSELLTYTYDHTGRLLDTNHTFQNGTLSTTIKLSSNTYDEIGRLITKTRMSNAETDNFEYNIRNSLTKIKNGTFEEKIYYNTTNPLLPASPCYNGNISSIIYNYGNNWDILGYKCKYDYLNRLTESKIQRMRPSVNQDFAIESFAYDKQGNILKLSRSIEGYTNVLVTKDSLTMTYNGNQVTSITDVAPNTNTYGIKEYQNKSNTLNEFLYDSNGNMIMDLDRGIVSIRYNSLNLPDTIQFSTGNQIVNRYDAAGHKLSTRYFTLVTPIVVTPGVVKRWTYTANSVSDIGVYYVGNREYKFSGATPTVFTLDKIFNDEGYLKSPFTSRDYFFFRKDHLGNNCMVIKTENPSGYAQRTKYYSSGIPLPEGTGDEPGLQTRKFNGKEFIEMHGYDTYDYGARGYYPAIMRFMSVDPLAEDDPEYSSYVYCGDNPVNRVDPDGRVWSNVAGAFLGAVVDYGEQVAANYVQGNKNPWIHNISLTSIGTATITGALTSGGSAIESAVAKAGVKVVSSVINNTVDFKTTANGIERNVETNPLNVVKNMAIDAAVDKAGGKLASKTGGAITKGVTTKAGHLTGPAKAFVNATGHNVTRGTTATVRNGVRVGVSVIGKGIKSGLNVGANEIKRNTNKNIKN